MKNITYFVAVLLLFSSFAAISIGEEAGEQQEIISLTFSDLEVIDSIDPYVELNYEGAGGRLYRSCQPVLPCSFLNLLINTAKHNVALMPENPPT